MIRGTSYLLEEYLTSAQVLQAAWSSRVVLPARPESLSDLVHQAVRNAIVEKQLGPGTRLTEAGLAALLKVSKTPVREALLKLGQVGLVEPAGVRGWRIVSPSIAVIQQSYELREGLEVLACRLAANRATGEEREGIVHAAAASNHGALAGDLDAFRAWDSTFHGLIAKAARNDRLRIVLDDLFCLIGTIRRRDIPYGAASLDCGRAHLSIAEHIAQGNADEAVHCMADHVAYVRDTVIADAHANGIS